MMFPLKGWSERKDSRGGQVDLTMFDKKNRVLVRVFSLVLVWILLGQVDLGSIFLIDT